MPFFGGGGGAAASNMVGATSSVAGTAGLVPAPAAGGQDKALMGNATFKSITGTMVPIPATRRTNGICFYGSSNNAGSRTAQSSGVTTYNIWSPLYVRETKAYTTASVYVGTASATAGAVGKVAIYTIDSGAAPNSLVLVTGTFAADSTGLKQPTFSSTVVSEGWYYATVGVDKGNAGFIGDNGGCTFARWMISGMVGGQSPVLLDWSSLNWSDFPPNPWNAGGNYQNSINFAVELT